MLRTEVKTVIYSVFLGLCIWLVDAIFYLRYTADVSFRGALLTQVPAHELYVRAFVLVALAVFGWIIGSTASRERSAERGMRRAEQRLDLILESAFEGVFGIDLQGRFTFVNEAAGNLLGYDAADLIGREMHELIHHTHADGHAYAAEDCPILHPAEDDGAARVTDEVFWRRDGSSIPVHYSARPIRDGGTRRGTVVVFRRVDPDEAAQEELERLRRLSQLILTWAGEGIFGIDLDGRITFANPAAAVMLGYESDDLIGREAHSLIQHSREDGEPHPNNQSLIYAAFQDDDVYHVSDEVFWRESGESFPAEYTSTPLREGGRLVGAVVVFKDITERKSAERDLRDTLQELGRSNRELETFAYVVSHDLQEPLRMVQSYVRLLEQRYSGKLDKDAREFIEFAVDGTKRMQGMIDDLLRYARVDSRGGAAESVDLNEVLGEALANLQMAIDDAGATVDTGELPTLEVDRRQMVQVFQNLIGNAIKFSGDRPPEVSITGEPMNGTWVVAVRDNGIGIPKEQGERVFALFQRLHGPDAYPGTGIGLAICKKIIEKHGGSIWVESVPGEGSTFYFSLPAPTGARISA